MWHPFSVPLLRISKIRTSFALPLAFLLLFLSPVVAQETSSKKFKSSAASLVDAFESQYQGKVGMSTMVLKSGKIPYSRNGTQAMVPASNLKLVTTAVALDKLGPNFRFKTLFYGPATEKDGIGQGDLLLKGGGDPTFYVPLVNDPLEPFENFAKAMKQRGLKGVSGTLIIDANVFDDEYISPTYHDRYLLDDYAAPVGGLSLNRNRVTLNVTTDGITTTPSSGSIEFINKVEQGGSNQIWVERPRGKDVVTVHGVVRAGETAQTTLTVGDPVRFAGSALFRVLRDQGVKVGKWGVARSRQAPSEMALLAEHQSPTLKSLITETNFDSDNLLAQHLYRKLGATYGGGGTVAGGEAVIRDFLQRHQITDSGLKLYDGSGLSDKNMISPAQLVGVLKAMWSHEHGQIFIDSLPGPGEGTLRRRLDGKVVRAKTGTLNDHSGLSGYVITAYGETVGFSILVNDVPEVWRAVELQNHLVYLLANWDQPL